MTTQYIQFLADLKRNIVQSRYNAARLANKEQLLLYFKTGQMLSEKIASEKWGAKVIENIAEDLLKQLPGLRGFSFRNLKNMRQFSIEYESFVCMHSEIVIGQLATAQLESFWNLSFTHHILLLHKCDGLEERFFYIEQAASQYWSVDLLQHHIEADLYANRGKLPNNFNKTLPAEIKSSALQMFQDDYLMDFISLLDVEDERVFESKVVADIKNFIMHIGKGFSFIGNQYKIEIGGEEFFIDLLFFNRHLQCLVVFELKRGKFKPEYAGQLNFYLNVLDEKVKLTNETPFIGIVLCKEKNNTVVEFAVKTIDKAMCVATYRTSKTMPKEMKGILPNTDDLVKLL